jgi:adenylate cyclase
MVAFGTTGQAVRCAQEMQQAVAAHYTGPAGRRLGLRVGVNAGAAIREGGDYFGMTVVIAERLCDRAREGQIFVSDGVRAAAEQVGDDVICRDLGSLSLKGLADPRRVLAGGADVAGDMSVASRLVEMFGGLYPG